MPDAITNTSPMVYLYRIGALNWLPNMFDEVWIPSAVVRELQEGIQRGYDVPDPSEYNWLKIVDASAIPSEWLALDLGPGEIAAMALALENQSCIVLLDDRRAREIAQAAGLKVWGTMRVLLEAKARGLTPRIEPLVNRLSDSGLWLSDGIRQRILILAGEKKSE
jgi:predicted nucleic acid-binding protein